MYAYCQDEVSSVVGALEEMEVKMDRLEEETRILRGKLEDEEEGAQEVPPPLSLYIPNSQLTFCRPYSATTMGHHGIFHGLANPKYSPRV